MACEQGHVWTGPTPNWTPAPDAWCDCGGTRYVVPDRPPTLEHWDIARANGSCWRCTGLIGAGEPFRHTAVTPRVWRRYCASCAKRATGEDPPTTLPVRRATADLRVPQPSLDLPEPRTAPMHALNRRDLARAITQTLDARQRQAGERE